MKPALVIQTRRLGDVILSLPLIKDLSASGAKVIVAAREGFYEDLAPFAPEAAFIPASALPGLASAEFSSIHNLSSSSEAAAFAARAKARKKFGYVQSGNGLAVEGFWRLYCASLTQNNRHNVFHWADLYRLDVAFPLSNRATEIAPRRDSGKIGLFIGASEAAKRPDALFWADLAKRLKSRGYAPILLGGPAEKADGELITSALKTPILNFAGKTSIAQLANILKSLDLLVTPDTGPMHFANWLGTPVLNLSMGNVSAMETGPASPRQRVLAAAMSCYGCWQCQRGKTYCKRSFSGAPVAAVIDDIQNGRTPRPFLGGLRLMETTLDPETGLLGLARPRTVATELDAFWRNAFLDISGLKPMKRPGRAEIPTPIVKSARGALGRAIASLSKAAKTSRIPDDSFWRNLPAHSRLFAGFIHMYLQNASWSASSLRQSLEWIERVDDALASKDN